MTLVLISYSREDRDVAARIAKLLEQEGFSTWWDWKITGGTNYREEIGGAIKKADKVVVLWSEHSVRSDFVTDEAARAKAATKLVPICIDNSEPPLGFGGLHTISMPDWTQLPAELVRTLRGQHSSDGPDLAASIRAPIRNSTLSALSGADKTGILAAIERDISEYLRWFVAVIAISPAIVQRTAEARLLNRHIPYLTRIVLISVLIGASLGALIPNRPPLIDRAEVFVVVALLWMFLSLLVHGVCRILGGREDAGLTMLLMMQALAFAYVASNFLTLLTFQIGKYYFPNLLADLPPGYVLLSLQFVLLLYLVPTTVSRAHGFIGARWFLVAFSAAVLTVLIGLPVAMAGGC